MIFNKITQKSGLNLITVPMLDNPSVTVLVIVETGSKYETKKESGISHFLEHMMFKGTTRRPTAIEISRELDSIGANYNAFTSQEFTGYYAKADARHLDKVIDVIADMYINPLLDDKEINKEKGVIIEELRMYRDLPQRHVHDLMSNLLHGDQPAGWDVIGTEETIKSFSHESFASYRDAHYVSGATTVIVSGSFDEKQIATKIEKAFAKLSTSPKRPKLAVSSAQNKPAVKTEYKETDQTHLVVAARSFSVHDARIPAMQVLATVLGGGMSSRLFTKMRDELGICYYVKTSHNAYTDHGDLTISAGVDNSRVDVALKEILKVCAKLKTELVGDAELQKVKDYIAGTTMLELETSDARAEFAGMGQVLKGKVELPEEEIAKINAVMAEDVRKLANEIFVDKGLNLALVGRAKPEDLLPLLKF